MMVRLLCMLTIASYLQNPAVKSVLDPTGKQVLKNVSAVPKISTIMVKHDISNVPTAPSPAVAPLHTQHPSTQRVISQILELMETRPIWTRRALTNHLRATEQAIKMAVQYVAYIFRSGPWREAVVKFGVDPRTDARYRVYQTLMFQITTKDKDGANQPWVEERTKYHRSKKGKAREYGSHIFDGKAIHLDGKVWQVCDITDPILQQLLATDNLRVGCDVRSCLLSRTI